LKTAAILVTLLAGCTMQPTRGPEAAKDAAREFARSKWPDDPDVKSDRPIVIEEAGANWLAWYSLPDGEIGGSPHIVLRKSDLKVVDAYLTQ
jgi:hypothetical protein